MREFLHVDDMAEASLFVMELAKDKYNEITEPMMSHINVGTGVDCTIRELAEAVASVTGFKGSLLWDTNKPDGTPRKLLSVDRLEKLGWRAKIDLSTGLENTYSWFSNNTQNMTL